MMARKKNIRRKKTDKVSVLRGCLTVAAELAGIAGFLLALYIFLKGNL
jgi:hypothetical protein